MTHTNFFYALLLTVFLWSCEKEVTEHVVSQETVPVSETVAAKSQCSGCVHYNAGLTEAQRKALALKFAPQLRFDRDARTFPQNAGVIFWNSGGRSQDNCSGKLHDNGISDGHFDGDIKDKKALIRSYYTIVRNTDLSHYFISYWWAYWRQPNCIGKTGGHDYDWEHITVKVKIAGETAVGAYYAQHSEGEYYNWSALERVQTHPIVYVGKKAHPSYKNRSRTQIPCARDYANPDGPKDYFDIWSASKRLVELRCDYKWAAYSGGWGKPGPGPLHRAYDIW